MLAKTRTGDLQTYDRNSSNMALESRRYVRIFTEEDVSDAVYAITDTWNVGIPNLMVTFVTGKTESSFWRQGEGCGALQAAVRKLVCSGKTLIFDNGLNYGVSALIGAATQEELSHEGEQVGPEVCLIGMVPTSQHASKPNLTKVLDEGRGSSAPTFPMENNHNYLVLINQPYNRVWKHQVQLELLLRSEFGRKIQTHEDIQTYSAVSAITSAYVSHVVVFCQGFTDELDQIAAYLENGIPVVILDGCGGTADVLASCISSWKGFDNTLFRRIVLAEIHRVYYKQRRLPDEIQEYIADSVIDILALAQREMLLTRIDVQDINALASLDSAVFGLAVRHSPQVPDSYLLARNWSLAIHGNKLEDATSFILSKEPWSEMEIPRDALMEALISRDREEFVDLILQQFPIRTFLTHLDYLVLFKNTVDNTFFKERVWDQILQHHAETPITTTFIFDELNGLIYSLTHIEKFLNFQELSSNALGLGKQDPTLQDQAALRALIIYATLFNRVELIKVLLKYSTDPIPLSIFVETMFRGLSRHNRLPEIYEELQGKAAVFDLLANDLFELGHIDSPKRCKLLLTRKLPEFENKTTLQLAYDGFSLRFLYHPAVRQFLDEYACGFIECRGDYGALKMVASAIFVFPTYLWLTFPRLEDIKASERSVLQADPVDPTNQHEAEMIMAELESWKRNTHKKPPEPASHHQRPPLTKMLTTVWSSPVVKYMIWFMTYHLFLVLIGVAIMLPPCMYLGVDIFVFVCTATILLDFVLRTVCDILYKRPFFETRRLFDLTFQLGFNILFFLYRITPYREIQPFTGRVVFAFGILYYYYSVWDIFLHFPTYTGAAIRLLKYNMVMELGRWLMMMTPLVIAAMVVWQAISTPDWPFTGDDWRHGFYRSLFTLFFGFFYELEYDPTCEASRIDWNNFSQPETAVPHDRCWLGDYTDYACPTVSAWSYIFVIHYYFILKLAMIIILSAYYLFKNIELRPSAPLLWTYSRFSAVMQYAGRSAVPWPFSIFGYILSIVSHRKSKTTELIRSRDVAQFVAETDAEAFTYWRAKIMRYLAGQKSQQSNESDEVEVHLIQHQKLQGLADLISTLQSEMKILTGNVAA